MSVVKRILMLMAAVLVAGGAVAQDRVPSLQDLVGARGSSGEDQMQQRGYNFIKTEKSGDSAFSYWQESENGQCVVVRTTEGRYASIVYAPQSDCQGGGGQAGHGGEGYDREDKFDTVCGVIVDGQTHEYRCKAVDFYDGSRKVKTALHFPDMNMRVVWKGGNQVVLHFEGMNPQNATFSTSEGETDIFFEGKTYFYTSDKGKAEWELQHIND
jgi:hypothetical protein